MPEAETTIQLGAFELDELIGEGGMATVWRAFHPASYTPVAIKVLAETRAHEEGVLRFEREVEAVAGLNHPGVVDVYDYGQVSEEAGERAQQEGLEGIRAERPFLAMELAERGSLADAMPVTRWPALRSLLLHVLDALAYSHAREVVHRDIKPDNVLLFDTNSGSGRMPKLTDFGIAHALGPEAASQSDLDAGETAGTPQYMPPEQLRARWRDFGPWTDLYALGTMAYEISAGEPPFTGNSFMMLATKHLEEPPPPLEPSFPVPEGFERWLFKLLAKRPTQRFETAADAAAHLEALPRMETSADAAEDGLHTNGDSQSSSTEIGMANTIESPVSETRVLSTDSIPSPPQTDEDRKPDTDSEPPGTNPMVPSTLSDSDWEALADEGDSGDGPHRRFTTNRNPPAQVVPEDWRRPSATSGARLSGIGLGLFGVRTPPMVDREQVRDRLWTQLRRTQHESTVELALLEGSAGLGKSRVAAETARRARELGCARVLRCSHSSLGGPLSGVGRLLEYLFVTWELDAPETLKRVRERLRDIYQGTRRGEDDRFLDDEAALLVGWMRPTSEQAGRLASRRAGYEAIRRLLAQLTRDRPLIVILDDLQWGSEALGLCQHLLGADRAEASERASLPLLLVGTLDRDAEPSVGVPEKLDELQSASRETHTHHVDPLDQASHRELVDELLALSPALSSDVAERSSGHPLFAIQLVSDLVDRDDLTSSEDGFRRRPEVGELPQSLESVWKRRLNFILDNENEKIAVEQAAALGRSVERAEWRALQSEPALETSQTAIAALRRRGLVSEDDQHITFGHHSLREAVATQAKEANRWKTHHKRCAETLDSFYPEGTRGVSRRIASHYITAGLPNRAVGPLLGAVEEAYEFGDYQLASELLDQRRDLIESNPDLEHVQFERSRGDLWRARLALRRGTPDRADELLTSVVSRARDRGWDSLIVEATQTLIDLQTDSGSLENALETATRLQRSRADSLDVLDRAALLTKIGRIHFQHGDLARARENLEHAREIYATTANDANVAKTDVHIASTFISEGNLDEAEDILEKALPIARRNGARFTEAHCMNCLGELARHRGNYDEAREYYRQASELWELSGDRDAAVAQLNEGLTLLDAGHYTDAFETLSEAREMLENHGMRQLLPPAEIGRAAHLVTRGDIEEAETCLERGIQIAEETQHLSRDFANLVDRVAGLCRGKEHREWADRLDELAARQRETLSQSS